MLAACIGNDFDLRTLATIHEKPALDTSLHLLPALREGLVLAQNDAYKLFQNEHDSLISINHQEDQHSQIPDFQFPRYKFVHDRVQQAAYSLIPVGSGTASGLFFNSCRTKEANSLKNRTLVIK